MIKYLWQLPQNLLGWLVVKLSKASFDGKCYVTKHNFGISLGKYIILDEYYYEQDLLHEKGHQIQSLYLGWLYLIVIGLPSALGNLYARITNKDNKWYYNQPWERWADKLGKVERIYH